MTFNPLLGFISRVIRRVKGADPGNIQGVNYTLFYPKVA